MPRLPAGPFRGAVMLLLIVANTLVHGTPIILLAVVKLVIPWRAFRRAASRVLTAIAEDWIALNTLLLRRMQRMRWELHGVEGLNRDGWYLVIANHRSRWPVRSARLAFGSWGNQAFVDDVHTLAALAPGLVRLELTEIWISREQTDALISMLESLPHLFRELASVAIERRVLGEVDEKRVADLVKRVPMLELR